MSVSIKVVIQYTSNVAAVFLRHLLQGVIIFLH